VRPLLLLEAFSKSLERVHPDVRAQPRKPLEKFTRIYISLKKIEKSEILNVDKLKAGSRNKMLLDVCSYFTAGLCCSKFDIK
jgi:hypothetical protein